MSDAYKQAGVDKAAGYAAVKRIGAAVKKTHNSQVLNELGGFGAFFALGKYNDPVLVSGTDGVGTKMLLALQQQQLSGIGQDCFAMCANDILCHGAKPLFFLDYLACGKLNPETAAEIIEGMAHACEMTGTALIGGEMAEMPGMYQPNDYDIAGFCVGVAERDALIDGTTVSEGDVIIGLPSSGLHSNGFSLARKLFTDTEQQLEGQSISSLLLEPTRLYINPIRALIEKITVKGMAHITGGGLPENLPRSFPDSLSAKIDTTSVPKQAIYQALQQFDLSEDDLWGTFNMGVGFCVIVSQSDADLAMQTLQQAGEVPFILGEMTSKATDEAVCLHHG
jgi:phosphoribosylformylglycinamidine cyclo-ligase